MGCLTSEPAYSVREAIGVNRKSFSVAGKPISSQRPRVFYRLMSVSSICPSPPFTPPPLCAAVGAVSSRPRPGWRDLTHATYEYELNAFTPMADHRWSAWSGIHASLTMANRICNFWWTTKPPYGQPALLGKGRTLCRPMQSRI